MAGHKIIFVSQEITPYLKVTANAEWGRALPQAIQSHKYEVRTFMPAFGDVNERRNQLHEVIRLSGMNIPIGNNDHPLVLKVASMQPSRIQVYFIDNDDYFQKSASDSDSFGTSRPDNDERMLFFARGMVETARKLQWEPATIQVSGWMTALVPFYVKRIFADAPAFAKSKIVYTVLPETEQPQIDPALADKLLADGASQADVDAVKALPADGSLPSRIAMLHSDAVVFQDVEPDPEITAWLESLGKPWSVVSPEQDLAEFYDNLYKSLAGTNEN